MTALDAPLMVEAERHVIGALLQHPELIRDVNLTAGMFGRPQHGAIFDAIKATVSADGNTIPDALAVLEQLTKVGETVRVGGGPYLHELMAACPTAVNVGYYARIVAEHNTRYRLEQAAQRLHQVAQQPDLDDALANAADVADVIKGFVSAPLGTPEPITGLFELGAFVDAPVEPHSWIIPGLLERMDRVIVVASEGAGKSTWARQVAACLSQGRHPLEPDTRIASRRTLIVDLENPPGIIRRKAGNVVDACRYAEPWQSDRSWIWTRPGGIDIRKASDAAALERVIAEVRPELVCLGPLYKTFSSHGDSSEVTASEAAAVLDRIRERYGVAWWLEHHAPLDQSGQRSLRPFGSGLWSRWPEFGLVMRQDRQDKDLVILDRFRGDRDERAWPDALRRSKPWPWMPSYDQGQWL